MEDAETEKLERIIRGYACNLQAQRKHEGNEDFDYAEIEFPIYLLHDINRELFFSGTKNFPVLEKYGLMRKFNLQELVRHFKPEFGRMSCLTGYEIDEVKGVRIIGKRVCIDVSVKAFSNL